VTHDLKAPLVTIRGFADYVERDVREGRTDRLAADTARIIDAVGRLQQLLDELFELSRAGRPVGPPVAVPAAELVQEALRLVRSRRPEGGARVEVAGSLPVVFGDRARLVQVFQNLLDNAVRFAGSAEAPLVTVEARPPVEGKAVLVVRDNGIASSPPSHRASASRSSIPGGKGQEWASRSSGGSSSRTAAACGSSRTGAGRERRPA
jgi:signal transduction histidine kinase